MAEHNELGILGERIAARHLKKQGYRILAKNYRFRHLEADIIATTGNTLVVVEVKTRQSGFMAGPEITVSRRKQKSLVKVANTFIEEHRWTGETRFDIISILMKNSKSKIEHLEDAFYPLC